MCEAEVNAFLAHLAVQEHVAASAHNQALAGLLFLYFPVPGKPLERVEGIVRAKRPKHLPAVLTPEEVRRLLDCLTGDHWLVHEKVIQRAIRAAVLRSGVERRATCHTLRHSFATHVLQNDADIRTVQDLPGHRSVQTTMIYTHVLNRGGGRCAAPPTA